VKSYPWGKPLLPFVRAYDRLTYWAASVLYPSLYLCLFGIGSLLGRAQGAPARYTYGIPIDQVFQIRFKGKRSFDMLLDHRRINKDNTVFIVNIPLGKEWVKGQRERGYNILVADECLRKGRIVETKWAPALFRSLLRTTFGVMACWNAPIPFLKASFMCIRSFVRWQVIMKHVHLDHYIYSNQEGAGQLATNIILREMGCLTWNYTPFLGGGYLRAKNEKSFSDYRHILWAFLNSDVFLGMNQDVIEYNKLHYQKTPAYHAIGGVYSGLVQESSNHLTREAYIAKKFPAYRGSRTAKIIAFFDTSFVDTIGGVTTFEDGLGFYQDILRLIQENEDILVIIKPSKDENYFVSPDDNWSAPENGAKIVRLWETLKSDPRVSWEGSSGDVLGIIGMSDLVVTHCMSSPTAEALGARKKAVWYESGQKHQGVMYGQIPGLIAHGYEELRERVDYLLYQITDREYEEYLDQYVRGRIESHLDGLALTRFRKLLQESMPLPT
jgi:polysaccharide biosynthesis PFTS motif protein